MQSSWQSRRLRSQKHPLPQRPDCHFLPPITGPRRTASMGPPSLPTRRSGMRHCAHAKSSTRPQTHDLMTSPNWCAHLQADLLAMYSSLHVELTCTIILCARVCTEHKGVTLARLGHWLPKGFPCAHVRAGHCHSCATTWLHVSPWSTETFHSLCSCAASSECPSRLSPWWTRIGSGSRARRGCRGSQRPAEPPPSARGPCCLRTPRCSSSPTPSRTNGEASSAALSTPYVYKCLMCSPSECHASWTHAPSSLTRHNAPKRNYCCGEDLTRHHAPY